MRKPIYQESDEATEVTKKTKKKETKNQGEDETLQEIKGDSWNPKNDQQKQEEEMDEDQINVSTCFTEPGFHVTTWVKTAGERTLPKLQTNEMQQV